MTIYGTPAPLTPPDCDLRGMEWMPLYGDRLFASETWLMASPEGRCATLLLIWAAWKQCPAGSLADQDRMLAQIAGYGMNVKAWQAVREEAMHGWVKCSDGRLYHPVICDFAMEAWDRRIREREKKQRWRDANAKPNGHDPGPMSTSQEPGQNGSGTGTGPGQNPDRTGTRPFRDGSATGQEPLTGKDRTGKEKKERKEHPPNPPRDEGGCVCDFDAFWKLYPRKVGRGAAVPAFAAACRKAPSEVILAAVSRAVWPDNPRFIPHPATWLRGERWLDEVDEFDPVLRAVGLSPEDFATGPMPDGSRLQ